MESSVATVIVNLRSGEFWRSPDTLPEGISSPGASTSSCLPPEWCVSSSSRDYGSIAVARWLSLYLVPPCLDLVRCLTWSRSSYCNARCCVCWDPMNIDTMFKQVVYLSMCSWSCMLSVISRCFGQVDAFNSKRGYLCSIVGSAISMPWPVTEGRLVIDWCCY